MCRICDSAGLVLGSGTVNLARFDWIPFHEGMFADVEKKLSYTAPQISGPDLKIRNLKILWDVLSQRQQGTLAQVVTEFVSHVSHPLRSPFLSFQLCTGTGAAALLHYLLPSFVHIVHAHPK